MTTTTTTTPMPTSTNPNMLDEALRLAALGLRVFPCHSIFPLLGGCDCKQRFHCTTPAKHPHIKEWPDRATTDADQIRSWWKKWPDANIAVAGGRGIAIVDVDPDRGGVETFARLQEEYGKLPRAWEVRTGGDGAHLYFSTPRGVEIRNCDKWKSEGVEIKGVGGYVIAPPSLHESGRRYEWERRDGQASPLFLPRWVSILETKDFAAASKHPAPKVDLSSLYKQLTSNRRQKDVVPDNPDKPHKPNTRTLGYQGLNLDVSPAVLARIVADVEKTFPRKQGERNHRLVELGQRLRPIKELKDKDSEWFEPVISMFLEKAAPLIGERDLAESMSEWNYIWGTWLEDSVGSRPIIRASEYMNTMPDPLLPPHGYKSKNARALVKLCAAMQATTKEPDGVWYISQRDAAREIGLDPEKNHRYVGSIFNLMVVHGMLEKIGEHVQGSPLAQRYKYHEYIPDVVEPTATAA